ncbi:uroporphyrinogen-III C-methyltransferase [Sinimarinibacterium thermocellulolyticum]|uniref:Uroporphyrinogen-III C-methyltransferase n=1 Tax=Sinimarinibacterium thermocellulolyticum TaxID=3170016 RepID=A0ABV2A7J0_9GAMM
MTEPATLDGLRVLVTRPAEQAEPLCRLLERHGARVTRLPLQVIEPVRQGASAAARLQRQRQARAWIFTSVNAVRYARALDAGVWPTCIAVGPATAAALRQAGIEEVITPAQRHDSDGVLALDLLHDVRDQDVVLVTGEGGRDAIETGLAARAARVTRVEVYRRVALPHTPEALARACADVDAAVFTNGESLRLMFTRIADDARLRLLDLQLVVPSRRVVEQALELGFRTAPLVPEQTGDAGYLRVLEHWWQTRDRPSRMTDQNPKQDSESPPTDAAATMAAAVPEAPTESGSETGAAAGAEVAAAVPTAAGRGRAALWGLLVLLVGLALVAAVGWEGWRRIEAMMAERDARIDRLQASVDAGGAQVERLQTRVADQAVAVQRNATQIARFGERLDAQDQAIGLLREELGGGRIRVQLAVVEQLLLLANDRLQVGREVDAAITALEAADTRLAALADPRLFAVREAIARERTALQAVPRADIPGAALVLASLIERAMRFALKAQVPERFTPVPRAADTDEVEPTSRGQRAWLALRRAVSSAFTIRREAGPPPQMLSDEQDALIRQVLALKLEGARAALLRRDAATFRELCRSASAWLGEYFSDGDPAIEAARAELTRLQDLQLDPPLPDISASLVLLRAQLEPAPQ